MNLPFDRVHDVVHSYGWLIFPWFGGWVALCEAFTPNADNPFGKPAQQRPWRFRVVRAFHNCRATGIA